jgi:hypothetical protein
MTGRTARRSLQGISESVRVGGLVEPVAVDVLVPADEPLPGSVPTGLTGGSMDGTAESGEAHRS